MTGRTQRARWFVRTAVFILFLYGIVVLLYVLGSSRDWLPAEWHPHVKGGFTFERPVLSSDGDWLLWINSSDASVCTYDLRHEGRVNCLSPGVCAAVRPVGILEGDLLVLRTLVGTGFADRVRRGWLRLFDFDSGVPQAEANVPLGTERTTCLERVDLDTGKVLESVEGLSKKVSLEDVDPTDFEMGSVSLSPDRRFLAWWKAAEKPGRTPLSATVTERIEIFSTGKGFPRILEKRIRSNGTLTFRSFLLREVGTSGWLNRDSCFFVSFLEDGSLVPFDILEKEPLAVIPVDEMSRNLLKKKSSLLYGPEGIHSLQPSHEPSESALVVWARDQDSIYFFLFDDRFDLVREEGIPVKKIRVGRTKWLPFSKRLLVEDAARKRLVALSPTGAKSRQYPLPPDWEEGFQIIGEDSEGNLIGTNRRLFMRTRSGMSEWETINLY